MFPLKMMQTAWKACLAVGLLLVVLAVTNGIWKTELRVENPEFLVATFIVGIFLLVVPAVVAALEAWSKFFPRNVANIATLEDFKITVKTPEPEARLQPPIKITGSINKKLPTGYELWLINEGSTGEYFPQHSITIDSDNWRSWNTMYAPDNFADNDVRNFRFFIVGRNGVALIRTYKSINQFYTKGQPARWGALVALTDDMKLLPPKIPVRLSGGGSRKLNPISPQPPPT
jgi:hypothetical protein